MEVRRWSPLATVTVGVALAVAIGLAIVPYVAGRAEHALVELFAYIALACLWNLMAGFAGLASFGQQAYVGIGAYALYLLAVAGVNPFVGIGLAALAAAVVAWPVSFLVLRLEGGYFAVATWVVAEVFRYVATISPRVGGNTGTTLPGLSGYVPVVRQAVTYWCALGVMLACVVGGYLLVRSRFGLDARAVHADPAAAAAAGVAVGRVRRVAYLLSALGTGAVGAVLFTHDLYVQPASAFGVQYSVYMMFMVVIGGLGTVEGARKGGRNFFALRQQLAAEGAWYLVLLGAVAIVVTLFAPRGLWGTIAARWDIAALPVGYRLSIGDDPPAPVGTGGPSSAAR